MEQSHIDWCKQLFTSLTENGVWGVPRSGLTFRKIGHELVLTDRMPWRVELGGTEEKWRAYQNADFKDIQTHFQMAGIEVRNGID